VGLGRSFPKEFAPAQNSLRQPASMATLFRRAQPKQEDLGEALGQISLYNEALGTVSTFLSIRPGAQPG